MRLNHLFQWQVWFWILLINEEIVLAQQWPICASRCITVATPLICKQPGLDCFCENVDEIWLSSCACRLCPVDEIKVLDEMMIYHCGLRRPIRVTCAQFWARDISSFSVSLPSATTTRSTTTTSGGPTFTNHNDNGGGSSGGSGASSSSTSGGRLSTGSKAGIGVGVALGVLIIGGLIVGLRKRLRVSWVSDKATTPSAAVERRDDNKMVYTATGTAKNTEKRQELSQEQQVSPSYAEMGDQQREAAMRYAEMSTPSGNRHELNAAAVLREPWSSHDRYELPGSQGQHQS